MYIHGVFDHWTEGPDLKASSLKAGIFYKDEEVAEDTVRERDAVRAELNGPVLLAIEQTYQNTDCKASLCLAAFNNSIGLLFAFW